MRLTHDPAPRSRRDGHIDDHRKLATIANDPKTENDQVGRTKRLIAVKMTADSATIAPTPSATIITWTASPAALPMTVTRAARHPKRERDPPAQVRHPPEVKDGNRTPCALKMALGQRCPGADVELIHHSDRGSQLEFKGSSQHWLVLQSVEARRVVRRQLQD
ncbi:MAG TPA: hypothetical protein VMU73_05235 [Gaiellaceae bacterium]|nr:hypothetical protein [Gaiellaceae bacterium]